MKNIGIIGGLGPLATVDFFEKIVRNTPVTRDQDNVPILIYNNPQVPDRTEAILRGGESPVPAIVKTAQTLEAMGADFLCLPCNTSFYFYEEIQSQIQIPLLHIADLTVAAIKKMLDSKVCVLGTEGTLKSRIYQDKLDDKNIPYVDIDENLTQMLHHLIYDVVKKNHFDIDITPFKNALQNMVDEHGVDTFVLACTELPILFERFDLKFNTIDPTTILALEVIRLAKEE